MTVLMAGKLQALAANRLAGPALKAFIVKFLGAGLGYLMFVAFARLLAPEAYGAFAFAFNLAIVASTVAGFGFATAILRYWPQFMVNGDQGRAKGVALQGAILTAVGITGLFAVAFVVMHIPQFTGGRDYYAVAELAASFCLADYVSGLLRAQGSTLFSMAPREILWRLLAPMAAFSVVTGGITLTSSLALCICAALLLVVCVPQIWRAYVIAKNIPGERVMDWKASGASLLPLWGAGVVYSLIQQLDVVVVGSLLSPAETGAYFAAQKTAMLLSLVLMAGSLVAAPLLAGLYHGGKKDELQKLLRQFVSAIAVATVAGYLILIFAGRNLLAIFDPHFITAYPILLILGAGYVIDSLSGPSAYLMQMTKYEGSYLRMLIACYLVVIACQLFLIPRFGLVGAALASATGVICWNVWSITLLRKRARLDPSILCLFLPVKS